MATTLERVQTVFADRYRIERELGRGGMATVYLGRDIKHDRSVAIKVLHPELAASIGSERFEREIRLAAKLQHPHILGLHDSGDIEGLFFFVMPFIQGESLRDRLDREGQLPIDDALQIVLEVADALGYAHAQGIVHRDIKPENILLSNGHALVADFGIAKAASESGGQKLTQTGMAIGTPVYMAPEQAVGDSVSPAADIYSMGCMLYEMLAGEPPFTGKSPHAIMARHAMESVPSIRIVRNTVPEEIEDAIFAAMAKSPADRPKTAAQFAEFLGLPLGATANRRATLRHTASRRVPSDAVRAIESYTRLSLLKRWVMPLSVLLLFAVGGAVAWQITQRDRPAAATPDLNANQIAVLYFADQSPDRSLGYLADGFTEALIASLATVPSLKVVSKTGVEAYRDPSIPIDSIARALDVGTLVRGEVTPEGTKLRVSLRLWDATGAGGVSRTLTLPSGDLLAIRDSIGQEAARLIRTQIGEEVRLTKQRLSTENRQAWSLYQRAELARKRGEATTAAGDTALINLELAAADSLFGQVETIDSKWPDPIVARGWIAYRASRRLRRDPRQGTWIDRGIGHAERALVLDPDNPDGLELRGTLRYFRWLSGLEADATKAEALLLSAQADLETAVGRNPTQAGAWATLSHLYYQTKTNTDVNIAATRAYEADSYLREAQQVLARLFISSYDAQLITPNAIRWCDETNRRFPRSFEAPRCRLFLMTTSRIDPDIDRAWRLADSVVSLSTPRDSGFQRLRANMLAAAVIAREKLRDSAQAVVRRSLGDADVDPTRDLTQFGAFVYVLLDERQKAIDLLKIYLTANERRRLSFAEDPGWWFRPIAADPAFRSLVTGSR